MSIDRKHFFDTVRPRLFHGSMKQSQVDGLNSILDIWDLVYGDNDQRWLAYCLATAQHETGATMQPIEEWGKGKGHKYGGKFRMNGQPYFNTDNIFYGRGYVQLTWIENYEKAWSKLRVDFVSNPEMVMEPDIAARIMFEGMIDGWFTGRKLGDYIRNGTCDYLHARKIINGMDKAELISGYAHAYADAIKEES
tara:strand:- start:128 stop:709 length:582 start_codon:yes stop_codon:yes gene_type:complete